MTPQKAETEKGVLRVASYNIHQGVGGDGQQDLQRVAQVINDLAADVVALQEVHVRFGGEAQRRQLDFLAQATEMSPVCGATMMRPDGHYGNAVLVRTPILREQLHDLSFSGREPRGVIDLLLETDLGPVRFLATHLGLRPSERRHQVRRLLAWIERAEHPVVLAGDFNEWFPWGRAARWLTRPFLSQRSPRTFPAKYPLFGLDRIFVAPPLRVMQLDAVDQGFARIASDHLPLLALIEKSAPRLAESAAPAQQKGAQGEQHQVGCPGQQNDDGACRQVEGIA
ncbi:endonuclease/exonuclease/phosphatase family protein [Geoalkalibacter subterraneus]|uniref:endonuclease/exonuclease/phosphatase family protein n=1 Tax=Geoalkalibacter subterraneus TaxID=483547 RepID=UPI00130E7C0F|nr:endonuclease/exonuclease/phosphatase family protein [Geoalkalibacter subterraneus]